MESKIMYRVYMHYTADIEEKLIVSQTPKKLTYKKGETTYSELKQGAYHKYFETFEEAKQACSMYLLGRIQQAERQVQYLTDNHIKFLQTCQTKENGKS